MAAATSSDYEYAPLRIASDIDRQTATVQLSLHAEYGGWELARVALHSDGSRRVLLRRKRTGQVLPGPLL